MHRMESKIRFDVLSPQWLSGGKNHLTAAPTAEQRIWGILVTCDIGENQTQRQAFYTAAALSEHPYDGLCCRSMAPNFNLITLICVHHVTE